MIFKVGDTVRTPLGATGEIQRLDKSPASNLFVSTIRLIDGQIVTYYAAELRRCTSSFEDRANAYVAACSAFEAAQRQLDECKAAVEAAREAVRAAL